MNKNSITINSPPDQDENYWDNDNVLMSGFEQITRIDRIPEIVKRLMVRITPATEDDRRCGPLRRDRMIQERETFVPFSWHIKIFLTILEMVFKSSRYMNPFPFSKRLNQLASGASVDDLEEIKDPPGGYLLIGPPGIGKTKCVEKLLRYFPQVIRHKKFKGRDFQMVQIPWIMVHAPANGSKKAFFNSMLLEIDRLTNEKNAVGDTKRKVAEDLENKVALAVQRHAISILVVDEIHNLRNNGEDLSDFLATMIDKMGTSILFIGNEKADVIFKSTDLTQYHVSRRSSINGRKDLAYYTKDSGDWNRLTGALWDTYMGLTDDPPELDDEIKDTLYNLCCGNVSFVKKLIIKTAENLLFSSLTGGESFSTELLEKTAKEEFPDDFQMMQIYRNPFGNRKRNGTPGKKKPAPSGEKANRSEKKKEIYKLFQKLNTGKSFTNKNLDRLAGEFMEKYYPSSLSKDRFTQKAVEFFYGKKEEKENPAPAAGIVPDNLDESFIDCF